MLTIINFSRFCMLTSLVLNVAGMLLRLLQKLNSKDEVTVPITYKDIRGSVTITEEDKMLSCLKEIKYTAEEMQSIIDDYMSTITEIKTIEWDKVEPDNLGKYGKACNWCQYRGSNKNRAGFAGCKCTRDLGFKPEPGVSFDKPSSAKKN